MLLSTSRVEDLILGSLQHGPALTLDLLRVVQKCRTGTSKQGVYAALRSLKKKGVIVVSARRVSLNMEWLQKTRRFVEIAGRSSVASSGDGSVVSLKEGESVQYRFRDPLSTDAFWDHTLLTLLESSDSNGPFVAYGPHCWFYLVRPDHERHLRDEVTSRGRQYLVTVGSNTSADRAIASEFDGEWSQYHMCAHPLFEANNYYVNAMDDILIEVWMDSHISARLDTFYKNTKDFDSSVREELNQILQSFGSTRLKVSRHKAKASRFQKRFLKDFYLRRSPELP